MWNLVCFVLYGFLVLMSNSLEANEMWLPEEFQGEHQPTQVDYFNLLFNVPKFEREQANRLASSIIKLSHGDRVGAVAECEHMDNSFLGRISNYLLGYTVLRDTFSTLDTIMQNDRALSNQNFLISFFEAVDTALVQPAQEAINHLASCGNNFFDVLNCLIRGSHEVTLSTANNSRSSSSRASLVENQSTQVSNCPQPLLLNQLSGQVAQQQIVIDQTQGQVSRIELIIEAQRKILRNNFVQLRSLNPTLNIEATLQNSIEGYTELSNLLSSVMNALGNNYALIKSSLPFEEWHLYSEEIRSSAQLMHAFYLDLTEVFAKEANLRRIYTSRINQTAYSSAVHIPEARDLLVVAEQNLYNFTLRGMRWISYLLSLRQEFTELIESVAEYYGAENGLNTRNTDVLVQHVSDIFMARMSELSVLALAQQLIKNIRRVNCNGRALADTIFILQDILNRVLPAIEASAYAQVEWGMPQASLAYERAQERQMIEGLLEKLKKLSNKISYLEHAHAHSNKQKETTKKIAAKLAARKKQQEAVRAAQETHVSRREEKQEDPEEEQAVEPDVILTEEHDSHFVGSITSLQQVLSTMLLEAPEQDMLTTTNSSSSSSSSSNRVCYAQQKEQTLVGSKRKLHDNLVNIFQTQPHLKIHGDDIKKIIKQLGGRVIDEPGNRHVIYFNNASVDHFETWHRGDRRGYLTSYWVSRVAGALAMAAQSVVSPLRDLFPVGWEKIQFGPRLQYKQKASVSTTTENSSAKKKKAKKKKTKRNVNKP